MKTVGILIMMGCLILQTLGTLNILGGLSDRAILENIFTFITGLGLFTIFKD